MRKAVYVLAIVLASCLISCSCSKSKKKPDYVPVDEGIGTMDIALYVTGDSQAVTVEFVNRDDEPWHFGEYYKLEFLRDGTWYYVPSEDYAVHDLAHELAPNQKDSLTYDLTPFGKLDAGDYRIACGGGGDNNNNYYAYFHITDKNEFIGTTSTE